MELRRPPGAWFTDRSSFVARPNARKAALYNHWNLADASFPVRVENNQLGPWLNLLGATPDPDDANQLCLQQHELEFYFLRAFTATDPLVSAVRTGGGFVLPSRLNDAFEALIAVGLDLTVDSSATVRNEMGPTVFLARIVAAVAKLPQLLILAIDDIIPLAESDTDVDEFTWPSHILMGTCMCPLSSSFAPFADLRGFQGFYLDADTRENNQDRFHLVSTALSSHAMVGSLASLPVAHYPSQVARWLVKTTWAPELASVRLSWPDLLLDVDDRVAFQTEDAALRAVVLRDRFPVLLLSCSALRHWVTGGSPASQFSAAVHLVEELLSLPESRSLSAFRSLDSFLLEYNSMTSVTGMDSAASPAERCAALVAHITEERRNRSTGSSQSTPADAPAPSANAGASTESVGTIFNNLSAYGDVVENFLRSSTVTGPLVWLSVYDEENNESHVIDDMKSGLAVLFLQPGIRSVDDEILRLAFLRYSQVLNQFLATKRHYRNPLFTRLALARESIVDFIKRALITDDRGNIREADKDWKIDPRYARALVAGNWDSENHYNNIIVSLERERSKHSAPAPVGDLHSQWSQPRSAELAIYIDRFACCFGAPRNDTQLGFSAFYKEVDLFVKRAPAAVNRTELRGALCQDGLSKPAERHRLMLRSPPPAPGAPSLVPRTFLRSSDPCFKRLERHDATTEEMLRMDKLIPGSLNALATLARNGGAPAPAPAPSPDGDGGGGGGGGGGGAGGKRKRPAKGNANPNPSPKSPSPADGNQKPGNITPGSLASSCSWKGQVLSIAREFRDKVSGQMKALPVVHFDVGAFCKKAGVDFNAFCWEFVCSYFLSAYDRANKQWRDLKGFPGQRAIRTSCARCPHSHLTSDHPEAVSAKHALPPKLDSMVTYFRQG